MLTSILVFIGAVADPGTVKEFIRKVSQKGFDLRKTEVLFLVLKKQQGDELINGIISVRILTNPMDTSWPQALNNAVRKAWGDEIVFTDLNFSFEIRQRKRVFGFPDDLQDLKTFLIMQDVLRTCALPKDCGRLNQKEILRFIYLFDKLDLKTKSKLLYKYLTGV